MNPSRISIASREVIIITANNKQGDETCCQKDIDVSNDRKPAVFLSPDQIRFRKTKQKQTLQSQHALDMTRGESLKKSIVYEKSSSASSMLFLIRRSRVVFHLSNLLSWSYWNSFSAKASWSPSSTAWVKSTSSWCSLIDAKLGSSSRYDSKARLVSTKS
jgi:hypothetical protein